ncbi:nitroreductase family protein [Bacillus sp. EB600]|uniref:nitroreductase family protein n=1 Tax=Bacillus sp. EB600 TaxID=2806345 RepID=UPI00210B3627|nr:nitroreductase family protein [Bacillus sp. EB600]MCQ6280371.1 nitroreductase family protein [Bacillus sp. EB600]
MDIVEVITTRRNIKKFKDDPINPDLIQKWLQAATMAPNHRMTQPWEIYVIGPETRAKINHKTNFGNAPYVMAVLSKHGATAIETDENAFATACFIQTFNLAAWAEGVGTFWSSISISAKNREILNVPEHYDIIGTIAVGIPEEIPEPKPRDPIQSKIKQLP